MSNTFAHGLNVPVRVQNESQDQAFDEYPFFACQTVLPEILPVVWVVEGNYHNGSFSPYQTVGQRSNRPAFPFGNLPEPFRCPQSFHFASAS